MLLPHKPGVLLTTKLPGQIIAGEVLSTTITVWLQSLLFPHASVARHVQVAVKVSPHTLLVIKLTSVIATLVPSAASLAVGGSKLHAVPASTVWLVAQIIVGGVVSITVTVWKHCEGAPQLLVVCQMRVATKVFPQFVVVIVLTICNWFVSPVGGSNCQGVPYSTVLSFAHSRLGTLVSTTVTAWLVVAVLPQSSVICQVRTAMNPAPQELLVMVSTRLMVGVLHPSVAVGGSKSQIIPTTTVLLVGLAMTGGVRSVTLMNCWQVLVSPQAVTI